MLQTLPVNLMLRYNFVKKGAQAYINELASNRYNNISTSFTMEGLITFKQPTPFIGLKYNTPCMNLSLLIEIISHVPKYSITYHHIISTFKHAATDKP